MVKGYSQRKRIIQTVALVGVYCLHLLFFQVTLANPNNETTKQLKKFFSRKAEEPKRNSSVAVDYSQLHKHASNSGSCSNFFNHLFDLSELCLLLDQINLFSSTHFLSAHNVACPVKIYLHNQTFLI